MKDEAPSTNSQNGHHQESAQKEQMEQNKKKQQEIDAIKLFDQKLMKYFWHEIYERKLEITSKKIPTESQKINEDLDKILPKTKLFHYLQQTEKEIDERIYKARLNFQEKLTMPSTKVKALLRIHIYSYCDHDPHTNKNYFFLRIQGKPMPVLPNIPGGTFQKFSHYFQRIEIHFDKENINKYQDIQWENPKIHGNQFSTLNVVNEVDGFEVKKDLKDLSPIKAKILLYVNYPIQEYKLKEPLAQLLDIQQDTRPRLLYHIWQYIKINSLQDNENPNIIINNKQLAKLFRCEKMDISTLTSRLNEYIEQQPEPIKIDFIINLNDETTKNEVLKDIVITMEDPHFNDILNLLSTSENESLLFPKHVSTINTMNNTGNLVDDYITKMNETDKMINSLIEFLKKHKYHYDFYEAYSKDPIKFIHNFIIQQNTLIRLADESLINDTRLDYTSSQYYKDYEEVIREYVDKYLNKK